MLLGMTWWASLYVLAVLIMIVAELSGLTGDETEEKTSGFEKVYFFGRLLNCLGLIALSILISKNLESGIALWSFLAIALYSLPFGISHCALELIDFIKNPTGKDESGESTGILSMFIGFSLIFVFYAVGIVIAISGLVRIWNTLF